MELRIATGDTLRHGGFDPRAEDRHLHGAERDAVVQATAVELVEELLGERDRGRATASRRRA